MGGIRILPEVLSNKIAAGEIVERPASVVKELFENSLDAQSTQVFVEIQKGGRDLIQISDNGSGMDRDDLMLAMERYATSKLHGEEDLFSIRTLGFRGEALPSIASVSEMQIVSRCESSVVGNQITIVGGKLKDICEVGAPRGTMVSVKRLFFNTPARRKYLKAQDTEMGHICDIVNRMALACPGVHIRLIHNGRTLSNWGTATGLSHRIIDVLGETLQGHLHPVALESKGIQANGFVASAEFSRSTSKAMYVYVNGRYVRDKIVDAAIAEGYKGRLMKGMFPLVILELGMPAGSVDVNVHPTKHTVRFECPNDVFDIVSQAVSDALKPLDHHDYKVPPDAANREYVPTTIGFNKIYPTLATSSGTSIHESQHSARYVPRASPGASSEALSCAEPQLVLPQMEQLPATGTLSSFQLIGQLFDTYILCESDQDFIMIDQHAAHERIVFDRLKKGYEHSAVARQGLLVPEKLELNHREADILESMLESKKPNLSSMGLTIEPFGGRTFLIKAIPAILAGKDISAIVMDLIDKAAEVGVASNMNDTIEQCLITLACHGATRANQRLSPEEMRAIIEGLGKVDKATHCPHGRPIVVRRTSRQIEKDFKRVV